MYLPCIMNSCGVVSNRTLGRDVKVFALVGGDGACGRWHLGGGRYRGVREDVKCQAFEQGGGIETIFIQPYSVSCAIHAQSIGVTIRFRLQMVWVRD